MKSDSLQHILDSQKSFIKKWIDVDTLKLGSDEMQHEALYYIGHAMEELTEVRRQLPIRKLWKSQKDPVDMEKVLDEYSDVIHFVINLGLVLGVRTSDDLVKIYDRKHEVNLHRQATGY